MVCFNYSKVGIILGFNQQVGNNLNQPWVLIYG
jgi:hypothetical protein